MMKKVKRTIACLLSGIATLAFSGCGIFGAELLVEPAKAETLEYTERNKEDFVAFKEKAEEFSATFSAGAYQKYGGDENFVLSPVSVFMALSLAAECANGDTRDEILTAFGVSYAELKENSKLLYRALNIEHGNGGLFETKTTGRLNVTNSVWIDENLTVKDECLTSLAQDYYCYSYRTDFAKKTDVANRAIQQFVKKQTKGLIDKKFPFTPETVFTLINTLYLKDIWNSRGDDIAMTSEKYTFTESDGETESVKLMKGDYKYGRAYTGDDFTSFYVTTYNGYKIKFILPSDGYDIDDVFTKENIFTANSVASYNGVDEENKIRYYTRCLFPEFKADFDGHVKDVLKEDFGITSLFDASCNLTSLTNVSAYCLDVLHVATLEVNRKGIEGAAVTVLPKAGAPGPDEYTIVYEDFIVDRSFGFVLTDRFDTTLFTGVVVDV